MHIRFLTLYHYYENPYLRHMINCVRMSNKLLLFAGAQTTTPSAPITTSTTTLPPIPVTDPTAIGKYTT